MSFKVVNGEPGFVVAVHYDTSLANTAIDAWQHDPVEAFCMTHSHEQILKYLDKDTIIQYAITHCSKLGRNLQGDE